MVEETVRIIYTDSLVFILGKVFYIKIKGRKKQLRDQLQHGFSAIGMYFVSLSLSLFFFFFFFLI